MHSLGPAVHDAEAREIATVAYSTADELAREYRIVRSPHLHNFLVNVGLRDRGRCYEWTHDMALRLRVIKLRTLELHWGCARCGTFREHNCVVVTAKGQPFGTGIVLDAWRYSGRLFWGRVAEDNAYPWKEDFSEWSKLLRPRG